MNKKKVTEAIAQLKETKEKLNDLLEGTAFAIGFPNKIQTMITQLQNLNGITADADASSTATFEPIKKMFGKSVASKVDKVDLKNTAPTSDDIAEAVKQAEELRKAILAEGSDDTVLLIDFKDATFRVLMKRLGMEVTPTDPSTITENTIADIREHLNPTTIVQGGEGVDSTDQGAAQGQGGTGESNPPSMLQDLQDLKAGEFLDKYKFKAIKELVQKFNIEVPEDKTSFNPMEMGKIKKAINEQLEASDEEE